jgi:hypothetical protein
LAALIPPSPPPVARSRRSRHRFQGTTPTTWEDDGQSNDPFLSRAARRVRKQTTSRQARACRAVVACDLQLLPLPNCQRTSAAHRVCQKQISGERFLPPTASARNRSAGNASRNRNRSFRTSCWPGVDARFWSAATLTHSRSDLFGNLVTTGPVVNALVYFVTLSPP